MVYNQSWAWELGFTTPPATPAEFKTQACAAAAASIDIAESNPSGGWIANIDPATVMSWIVAFGGNGINQGGDGYDFKTPEVKAAFGFIKSMFKSGCAWIPETRYSEDEFSSRQGLFYSTSITDFPYLQPAFKLNEWGDEWIPIPYPSLDGDAVVNLVGLSYAILQSTAGEQLAAWIFIQWMAQPEHQARIIEASSSLPTRISTIGFLDAYASENPQWSAALEMLPSGFVEPYFGSWEIARWALSDAVSSLVSPSFSSEEIPMLIEELNSIMVETHYNNP
jgi:ABC-type glycerol-3-phosphate transport system substrate-binding protein